jgi:hypothetical protein
LEDECIHFGPSFVFPPLIVCGGCGSGKDEEPSGANVLRLIQIRVAMPSLAKISPARQANSAQVQVAASSSKNAVSFSIRTHNETLSVVAMCVNNPDRSPARIDG